MPKPAAQFLPYRLAYRFYRWFTGARHWLERRLTPAGLAVTGGGLMAGLLGIDYTQTVGHQVAMFLAALLFLGWLLAFRFRTRFAVDRLLPRYGSVGVAMPYRVSVTNRTPILQKNLTLLEDLQDPRPSLAEYAAQLHSEERHTRSFSISARPRRARRRLARIKPAAIPDLPPRGSAEVLLELTPLRRGVLRFSGVTIARTDPLGLFRALSPQPLPQTVLILPRRYFLPPIPLPGSVKYQQGGVTQASSVGESEEFVALRDYRPGDPLRRIHWKSWAKTGRPIVKEYQDEYFVRHALVLDTFLDRPEPEAFEEAVSVAASFACTIQTQESLLDLLFIGPQAFCFTAGRGVGHTEQILEILAAVNPCREEAFEKLERLVLDHAPDVTGCILLFLDWDESRRKLVRQLRQLKVPLLVLVLVNSARLEQLRTTSDPDRPDHFHLLDSDKVAEGLARLC
jgi:uncharacterized protein (DUF58 family)